MSSEKIIFADDEFDDDGSESGSSGTYSFTNCSLRFNNYVGSVGGLRSGIFVPTGVKSICDIFTSDMFVPIGVDSKGG